MHALGFQSVELEGIREEHLHQVASVKKEIRRVRDQLGLQIPYFCIVLPKLSSPDAGVRREQLKLFRDACKLASDLGAKGIVDNGPLPPYQFPRDIPVTRHYDPEILRQARLPVSLSWKSYYRELCETYREACAIAADAGCTYHMHPCEGVLTATTDGYLRFSEAVSADNLRFNFDTANLYAMGENLSVSWLQVHEQVDYVHISDNRGHKIEHLEIGEGAIDWESFLGMLQHTGFRGDYGIDIGGDESSVPNLISAYRLSASYLDSFLMKHN